MVSGKLRSRRERRVFVRIPSGKSVLMHKPRKDGVAVCAVCKRTLMGAPRLLAKKLSKLPKSKKRPSRPYGGNLCSACMRAKILEKVM